MTKSISQILSDLAALQRAVAADSASLRSQIAATARRNVETRALIDGVSSAGVSDGAKGDIAVTVGGTVWTVAANAITLAKVQDIATARVLGRATAGSGDIEQLTSAQLTALVNQFSSSLPGLVPASGGGTSTFLRADGSFAAPPSATVADGNKGDITASSNGTAWAINSGAVTDAKLATMATKTVKGNMTGGTAAPTAITMASLAAELPLFSSSARGLVGPAGTVTGLRVLHDDGVFRELGATDLPELQQTLYLPAYIHPTTGAAYWTQIKNRGGSIVPVAVFNPSNGPGYTADGNGPSFSAYSTLLPQLTAVNIKPVGYISLNYRDEASSHSGDEFAGTVGALSRFTAATSDICTSTADGTQTSGGAAGAAAAHGLTSGFGPIQVKLWNSGTTTGALPTGLAANTNYYVHVLSTTTFKLCTTRQNAIDGVSFVDITAIGSGGHYFGLSKTLANIQNVKDEIDLYRTRFGSSIKGFFFDEARLNGTANVVPYCTAIYNYIKSLDPTLLCIWNDLSATNDVIDVGDVFVNENTVAALLAGTGTHAYILDYPAEKFWLLGHTGDSSQVATFVAFSRANGYGRVSMNDSSFSNIPSFWETFVDAVIAANETPVEAEPEVAAAYGSCSYTEGAFTGTAVAGTTFTPNASYAKIPAVGTSTGALNSEFTFTNTSGARLTYSGTVTRNVRVSLCMTYMKAAGEEVMLTMRIYRSGSSLPDIKAASMFNATKDVRVINFEYLCTLTAGQYLEPYAKAVRASDGSTANDDLFTVLHGMMTITEID